MGWMSSDSIEQWPHVVWWQHGALLWEIHGQAVDDVEGLAGEVFCDGFYVGVDDGLFAGSALEVLEVLWIVHKEVLCEDCGAEWISEDVEA